MSWAKLDDRIDENAKLLRCKPEARWIYIAGLAYCSRALTDGFIPAAHALRSASEFPRPKQLIAQLVRQRLWESTRNGYRVHDWEEYNPPAEVEKDRRRKARDRLKALRTRVPNRGPRTHSGTRVPNKGVRTHAGTTTPDPDPEPEVDQDLKPPPPAGGKRAEGPWFTDGTESVANHTQRYFLERLHVLDPGWARLTRGGFRRLTNAFGNAVVATALGELWEDKATIEKGPYPLLKATCERVAARATGSEGS